MAFRALASKIRSHVYSPSQGPSLPAEPVAAGGNALTNVLTFSLAILGQALPGAKAAAIGLLDIIHRAETITECKATLQALAAHMEYLLFLSSKVTGDVGTDAVGKLEASIEQLKQSIPGDKHRIVAFFLADDTKARIQTVENHFAMTIHAFQAYEKVGELLQELKELKNRKQSSESPYIKQDLENLELNTKRGLNFTVISVGRVERNISHSRMFVTQDLNSLITSGDGIVESMRDVSIDADGDINFTTNCPKAHLPPGTSALASPPRPSPCPCPRRPCPPTPCSAPTPSRTRAPPRSAPFPRPSVLKVLWKKTPLSRLSGAMPLSRKTKARSHTVDAAGHGGNGRNKARSNTSGGLGGAQVVPSLVGTGMRVLYKPRA
ncbi:hypothetical protein C8J57DRAFT_1504552 [Mycena rebaudengoi]|nr:hypothetical protein C8J57DRAFT_1504552 [Mycena rebaudengoi]